MGVLRMRGDRTPLVKICGLRRAEDIVAAGAAGADLIGLVFAPSRRRVSVEEARMLLDGTPGHPHAVGVFVNADQKTIHEAFVAAGLALVQLSGQETPAQADALGLPYLKVLHIQAEMGAGAYLHIMTEYRHGMGFVLDSVSPLGGGSGVAADWVLASAIIRGSDCPVLLAGGLSPANLAAALDATAAPGVDVSSGVERDGWKDPALIRAFVRAARGSPVTLGAV